MPRFNPGLYKKLKKEIQIRDITNKLKDEKCREIQELKHVKQTYEQSVKAAAASLANIRQQAKREKLTVSRRLKIETRLEEDNSDKIKSPDHKGLKAARIAKTVNAVQNIHGENAVKEGLWSTLVKNTKEKELFDVFKQSNTVEKFIKQRKKKSLEYKFHRGNIIRSLKVLYLKGILSREKYNSIRKSNSVLFLPKELQCSVPNFVGYNTLQKFINGLNNCGLYRLDDIKGCRRNLEKLCTVLAQMYLAINEAFNGTVLKWFGNPDTFVYSIGADGAPFGKANTATAFLIGVVNTVERLASPDHNYLVLAGNCSEDCPEIRRHIKDICDEIEAIEQKHFVLNEKEYKFRFQLFPSDQKFLASSSGELNNASSFPCSYANVHKDDFGKIGGTFGYDTSSTWQPWSYDSRLKVAKMVQDFKSKNPAASRNKVTTFIASLKSRQEFVPLLGKYIDFATAEPLHLKNSTWQGLNSLILVEALSRSDPKVLKECKTVASLPGDCPFKKYMVTLKNTVKAGRLFASYAKWFRENNVSTVKVPDRRFTGEESSKLSRKFMDLIMSIYDNTATEKTVVKLHVIAIIGLYLRESVSLFSRIHVNEEDLRKLQSYCTLYYNSKALFDRVNLSDWIVGHIVPVHARLLHNKYGYGLGLATMQGREAKHQRIVQYTDKSSVSHRWETAFKHEFVHTVFLRQEDPYCDTFTRNETTETLALVPGHYGTDSTCYCGLAKSINTPKCDFCSTPIHMLIEKSCNQGKYEEGLKKYVDSQKRY